MKGDFTSPPLSHMQGFFALGHVRHDLNSHDNATLIALNRVYAVVNPTGDGNMLTGLLPRCETPPSLLVGGETILGSLIGKMGEGWPG
jgi:hypothetical protein